MVKLPSKIKVKTRPWVIDFPLLGMESTKGSGKSEEKLYILITTPGSL